MRGSTSSVLVAAASLFIGVVSCTSPSDSNTFTIKVDSITGPNAVSGGIAFENTLWGTIGPNGCYHFLTLSTSRSPSQIDVTVIGEKSNGSICTQQLPLLREVLRVEPIVPNAFFIVVHQPDGSTLSRRIYGE